MRGSEVQKKRKGRDFFLKKAKKKARFRKRWARKKDGWRYRQRGTD